MSLTQRLGKIAVFGRALINRMKNVPSWHLKVSTVADTFVRLMLEKEGTPLKVDFVNDVAFHWGDFVKCPVYYRVDNWRNILSNKLCALSRRDVKDIVDIIFIAKRYRFNWEELLGEAKQKDLWVDPLEICKIISEFPPQLLDSIKWISPVNTQELQLAISGIHDDIFWGRSNSIAVEEA